jgi:O-antigen ligase
VPFWLWLGLLVWAPIPLGSNRPWAWTVLEIGAFLLVAAWTVAWALGRARVSAPMRSARMALALLAAIVALQVLQVMPLPAELVAFISPEAARLHLKVAADGRWITLSIDPHASREALLKTLAYGAMFFLALAFLNQRSRVLFAVRLIVYASVVHAVYAVLMHLVGTSAPHFGTVLVHASSASGTYANRNHFAGHLEMTLALGIGLLIAGLSDRRADSWKRALARVLEWILSPKMVLRLSLCILVIALTTTHSRMGNTAFFASLLVAGVLGIALSRRATRNTVFLLASLVVIDLAIVGSWFGVEKLAQRLGETTMVDVQEREEPAAYALPLIRDYAAVGAGAGTFYIAFPRYRPESVALYYDYAHNDYAQFAAELGITGFALLALFVILALAAALAAQWKRRDPLMRGMAFACIMGVTSILIHSWVDFNLQIPANASLFMVLLALGWISRDLDRHDAAARGA